MIGKSFRRWHNNFDRKTPAMVYSNTLPQKTCCSVQRRDIGKMCV